MPGKEKQKPGFRDRYQAKREKKKTRASERAFRRSVRGRGDSSDFLGPTGSNAGGGSSAGGV